MKSSFLLSMLAIACFFVSCEKSGKTESENLATDTTSSVKEVQMEDTTGVMTKGPITLRPLLGSMEFSDAVLELNSPAENAKIKSGEKVKFAYELKNYQLKNQTPNQTCNQCNNSKDGQHIHLILNNDPYKAIYNPQFDTVLKDGHYVALSFLSRSYHESIKQFEAFDLRQFTVGKGEPKKVDLTKPLLFYSRPKGEYVGEFAKNILLDFYLINTELAENGNQVKVTVNSNEFFIKKWQPYIMEGLPMGENKVKIELMDKDGMLVDSPFNSVERKFTLKEK